MYKYINMYLANADIYFDKTIMRLGNLDSLNLNNTVLGFKPLYSIYIITVT